MLTTAKPPTTLQLGLFAPTLTEQGFIGFLPQIEQYEADDLAISRLHARGLITYAQHVTAREKLAKKIKAAVRLPVKPEGDQ